MKTLVLLPFVMLISSVYMMPNGHSHEKLDNKEEQKNLEQKNLQKRSAEEESDLNGNEDQNDSQKEDQKADEKSKPSIRIHPEAMIRDPAENMEDAKQST